jgi:hypothetical protein
MNVIIEETKHDWTQAAAAATRYTHKLPASSD